MHRYASLYIVKLRFDNLFITYEQQVYAIPGSTVITMCVRYLTPFEIMAPHFPAAVLNITYRM